MKDKSEDYDMDSDLDDDFDDIDDEDEEGSEKKSKDENPNRLSDEFPADDEEGEEEKYGWGYEDDLDEDEELDENDILFLDTSHIVKTGNDVTYWLFNILPVLKPGVIIHIHDIFWPFEYSKEWIENQKCYNEIYFIRAFLMNNNDYEILFFNSYVQNEFKAKLIEIDLNLIDNSGASLYLRKK
jgi:hypothetical protein